MIRKSDVKWWILEARKHPEAAADIIEQLAERLIELDEENERLRNQLIRQPAASAAQADAGEVQSLRRQVQTLKGLVDNQSAADTMLMFLSERRQMARLPWSGVHDLIRQSRRLSDKRVWLEFGALAAVRPHDEIWVITNRGRGLMSLPTDAPPWLDQTCWPDVAEPLPAEERVAVVVAVRDQPRFWTLVTRQGYVQRFLRATIAQDLQDGKWLQKSPFRNDEAVAMVSGDRSDLIVLTRWGKAVRFAQRDIAAQGSAALTLDQDDAVVAALPLSQDTDMVVVTTSGYAGRVDTAGLKSPARGQLGVGGQSKRVFLSRDVHWLLVGAPQDDLLGLTYSGRLVLLPIGQVPCLERAGQGKLLGDLRQDPLMAVVVIPQDWLQDAHRH